MHSDIITLIIADDHALFREGVKSFLTQEEKYKVIAEASNGTELIESAKSLKPMVIITDIQMPIVDGIMATRQIIKEDPNAKIIAMSFLDIESAVIDMLEAGAKGYIYKAGDPNEIKKAISSVLEGQHYFSVKTKPHLIEFIAKSNYQPFKFRDTIGLSDREIDIIKMVCNELYPNKIADELGISKRTVDVHLQNIYKKLGVNNAVGLFAFAIRNSIVHITNHNSFH